MLGLYLRIKAEIQDFLSAGNRDLALSVLTSEFFKVYRPVLFHKSLLGDKDPQLPGFSSRAAVPLYDALTHCGRFYELLQEVMTLKRSANQAARSNEAVNTEDMLEICRRLTEVQVQQAYVVVLKWRICLQVSELYTAQLMRVKVLLHQIAVSQPREENSRPLDLPYQQELIAYSEGCFANALACRDKGQYAYSGFWLSLVRKIHKVLGRESHGVDTYYAQALQHTGQHSKAVTVLETALHYLHVHDYDDGSRAVVMKLLALVHADTCKHEQAAKWYQRILALGMTSSSEAVDIYSVRLGLADQLRHMHKLQEAESVLNETKSVYPRLGTGICNCYGLLYFFWEQFEKSEKWFLEGKALKPRLPGPPTANLIDLYFKQNRMKEAETLLASYLRQPGKSPVDRSYVVASMGRQCLARANFEAARVWLQKAAELQEKYQANRFYRCRTSYFLAKLNVAIGKYEDAEEQLLTLLEAFKEERKEEERVMTCCALAEVYLQTHRVSQAVQVLGEASKVCESLPNTTYTGELFEMQGRVCLVQQQTEQARAWLNSALSLHLAGAPQSREIGRVYSALGSLELRADQSAAAAEHFTKAVCLLGPCVSVAEAYCGLADLAAAHHNSSQAKAYLDRALALFKALPKHPLAAKLRERQSELRDYV